VNLLNRDSLNALHFVESIQGNLLAMSLNNR